MDGVLEDAKTKLRRGDGWRMVEYVAESENERSQ